MRTRAYEAKGSGFPDRRTVQKRLADPPTRMRTDRFWTGSASPSLALPRYPPRSCLVLSYRTMMRFDHNKILQFRLEGGTRQAHHCCRSSQDSSFVAVVQAANVDAVARTEEEKRRLRYDHVGHSAPPPARSSSLSFSLLPLKKQAFILCNHRLLQNLARS